MKRNLYRLLAIVVAVICLAPAIAYTNSAQPPALVIIMKNAPDDTVVSLITKDGLVPVPKSQTAWESYYVLYDKHIDTVGADSIRPSSRDIRLQVSGNGTVYEQPVEKQYRDRHDSVITLDFAAQTITAGKLLSRSILLVGMRLFFTLAIEGLVFFLFGFRDKRSWRVFLVMNLLTQGMLNIALNNGLPLATARNPL